MQTRPLPPPPPPNVGIGSSLRQRARTHHRGVQVALNAPSTVQENKWQCSPAWRTSDRAMGKKTTRLSVISGSSYGRHMP
eukprot:7992692-Pyramimonas_sp.AAC.1